MIDIDLRAPFFRQAAHSIDCERQGLGQKMFFSYGDRTQELPVIRHHVTDSVSA
ncbi:MAG TPA: hypothetical protein VL286_03725 [Rhizomicrobium sp.]|nr:hypothetical protein [Rhizomicrobium sp.]